MGIQKSDVEDRRREDLEMLIINKKRKYKDQEDHLDKVQEDPSTTISKDGPEYLREEVIEVDRQSVKNEIFSKYVLEEIEIDRTEEQQVNNKTRNEAIAQEKISYSRALKSSLKDGNQNCKHRETDIS
ncbi:hypothetical protein F8M41_015855 [Gigaspora margarita]|uniref:Uncharacterized protein n=1 Tax=Gigaspora margarita TaxID=4874 RepID=A0A8H4AQ22_GIGMA|nr:hypothetical protein F8M41_015855 [Gigaspora margarita]